MSNAERRFNIEGADLGYPTYFHKGLSGLGIFAVSSRAANALIAKSGFQVAEIAPGKAAFSLACVHYVDTECGPYLSTWRDVLQGNIASYSYRLPVSTKASVDCGVLMWGFPKTVDDLTYEDEGSHARFTWKLDGQNVLSYRIKSEGNKQPNAISPPCTRYTKAHPTSAT